MPKKIFVLFLTLAIIFSAGTISASAEELDTPADHPVIEEYTRNLYSDIWTTIYTGSGSSVELKVRNATSFWVDIKMIDYNGNQVWYQYHTIQSGNTGYYHVGSNVRYVQMRVSDNIGLGHVSVTVNP